MANGATHHDQRDQSVSCFRRFGIWSWQGRFHSGNSSVPVKARKRPGCRFWALTSFAIETAMRRKELCSLAWFHVNPEDGYLNLPGAITKNRKPRLAPLTARALRILKTQARTSEFVFATNSMLKTDSMHEVHHLQRAMRNADRYWYAALLPLADGFFLVNIHWPENTFERIQALVCAATLDGVFSMHSCEDAIQALHYIAPPNHDGTPREPPIPVDAIAVGQDAEDSFRNDLLVRALDGQWHACAKHVDIARVDERETLFVLHKYEPETSAA